MTSALDILLLFDTEDTFSPPEVGNDDSIKELADLMQGVIDGDYKPDSFTLQPIRAAS